MAQYRTAEKAPRKVVAHCLLAKLANTILVERHAHGGVHAHAFKSFDFALGGNPSRGNDRHSCSRAQLPKPGEIRAS